MNIKIKLVNVFVVLIIFFLLTVLVRSSVFAQAQTFTFSGNSKESYQCFDEDGSSNVPTDIRDTNGYWLCECEGGGAPSKNGMCGSGTCQGRPGSSGCLAAQAVLKPPALQQLEIWFVRILYVVWALVGTLSFFFLALLGYRYMISRGDVTKITEIRQKIIYYIVGVVLVFLAVPILTTVFRLLGINDEVDCYNVEMPAFQFFHASLCSDPIGAVTGDPCNSGTSGIGLVCDPSQVGEVRACSGATTGIRYFGYTCTEGLIWVYTDF